MNFKYFSVTPVTRFFKARLPPRPVKDLLYFRVRTLSLCGDILEQDLK